MNIMWVIILFAMALCPRDSIILQSLYSHPVVLSNHVHIISVCAVVNSKLARQEAMMADKTVQKLPLPPTTTETFKSREKLANSGLIGSHASAQYYLVVAHCALYACLICSIRVCVRNGLFFLCCCLCFYYYYSCALGGLADFVRRIQKFVAVEQKKNKAATDTYRAKFVDILCIYYKYARTAAAIWYLLACSVLESDQFFGFGYVWTTMICLCIMWCAHCALYVSHESVCTCVSSKTVLLHA